MLEALKLMDQRPVGGEYEVWFHNYLAASLFFLLAVDAILKSGIWNQILTEQCHYRFIKK